MPGAAQSGSFGLSCRHVDSRCRRAVSSCHCSSPMRFAALRINSLLSGAHSSESGLHRFWNSLAGYLTDQLLTPWSALLGVGSSPLARTVEPAIKNTLCEQACLTSCLWQVNSLPPGTESRGSGLHRLCTGGDSRPADQLLTPRSMLLGVGSSPLFVAVGSPLVRPTAAALS